MNENKKLNICKFIMFPCFTLIYIIFMSLFPSITGFITIGFTLVMNIVIFAVSKTFKNKHPLFKSIISLMLIFLLLIGVLLVTVTPEAINQHSLAINNKPYTENTTNLKEVNSSITSSLKLHYIDDGKNKATLIKESLNLLIDEGFSEKIDELTNYLKSENINRIDYLILTSNKEEHIAALKQILEYINVNTVIIPKLDNQTNSLITLNQYLVDKNIKSKIVSQEEKLSFKNFYLDIIPVDTKADENTSLVLKLIQKNNYFLFTGDLSKRQEEYLISKNVALFKTDEKESVTCTSEGKNLASNTNNDKPLPENESKENYPKDITINAKLNNQNPKQNSTIYLTVTGPEKAYVKVLCKYKSGNTEYSGVIGTPISIDIGNATLNYKVDIDVFVYYKGKSYSTKTCFTPSK